MFDGRRILLNPISTCCFRHGKASLAVLWRRSLGRGGTIRGTGAAAPTPRTGARTAWRSGTSRRTSPLSAHRALRSSPRGKASLCAVASKSRPRWYDSRYRGCSTYAANGCTNHKSVPQVKTHDRNSDRISHKSVPQVETKRGERREKKERQITQREKTVGKKHFKPSGLLCPRLRPKFLCVEMSNLGHR